MANPFLLQQDGFKILQQNGGGLWLSDNSSRLSKVIAWENKVPFPIKYCVKCRVLIPANHRDYLYCEKCDKEVKIVSIEKSQTIKQEVNKVMSGLRTVPTPIKKEVIKPKVEVKKPDVYGRYEGNELHISIKK